jgi:hypothetical protein
MAKLTRSEKHAAAATGGLAIFFIATALWSFNQNAFLLAVSLGCVGGLMHELAQSGGKILLVERKEDGVYLGSLSGMMLGGISGVMAAHAIPVPEAGRELFFQNLAYEAFLAGLGLKGIVEAAAGKAVDQKAPGAYDISRIRPLLVLPAAPARVPVAPSWQRDESIT